MNLETKEGFTLIKTDELHSIKKFAEALKPFLESCKRAKNEHFAKGRQINNFVKDVETIEKIAQDIIKI